MTNETLHYHDKLLPVQPAGVEHYSGAPEKLYEHLFETIMKFSGITPPEQRYTLATSPMFSIAEMGSNPLLLQLLELLVRLRRPRKLLEIGTFVGVSAMALARGLTDGGRVITVEKFDHFAAIARQNFHTNGFKDVISVIEGDAFSQIEVLKREGPFDLVFLDGNKERYHEYFTLIDPIVSPGGIFIVDDVLFHGDVLTGAPQTEKGAGVFECLERVRANESYFKVLLPISNGVLLMLKQ